MLDLNAIIPPQVSLPERIFNAIGSFRTQLGFQRYELCPFVWKHVGEFHLLSSFYFFDTC